MRCGGDSIGQWVTNEVPRSCSLAGRAYSNGTRPWECVTSPLKHIYVPLRGINVLFFFQPILFCHILRSQLHFEEVFALAKPDWLLSHDFICHGKFLYSSLIWQVKVEILRIIASFIMLHAPMCVSIFRFKVHFFICLCGNIAYNVYQSNQSWITNEDNKLGGLHVYICIYMYKGSGTYPCALLSRQFLTVENTKKNTSA